MPIRIIEIFKATDEELIRKIQKLSSNELERLFIDENDSLDVRVYQAIYDELELRFSPEEFQSLLYCQDALSLF